MAADGRDAISPLLGPVEEEVSCEACFDHLDEYVELEVSGREAAAVMPGMRAHLEGCPACREDHESLRDLVRREERRAGAGVSPGPSRRR
jgi:anti-sigma factor RsiW